MFKLSIAAFTLDDDNKISIERAKGDISLCRSSITIHDGGMDAAIACYTDEHSPDLLIVQSTADKDGLVQQLERLAEVTSDGTQVIVIGIVNEIDFYRGLLGMGVGEYILTPSTGDNILRAINNIYGVHKTSERGRVIGFLGSKGGCGSSTLCHNTAWNMSTLYNRPISLIDLDIQYGTVPLDFNQDIRNGLRDILSDTNITEAKLERVFSKVSNNLWLLASGPAISEVETMTGEVLDGLLTTISNMSNFIVLDIPHMWNKGVGHMIKVADELVVVTEPDLPGLKNTQLMFETFERMRPQGTVMRYILNNVGLNPGTEISAKDFEAVLGQPPITSMAFDAPTFRSASSTGQMIAEMNSQKARKHLPMLNEIALVVAGKLGEEKRAEQAKAANTKPGFFDFLKSPKKP